MHEHPEDKKARLEGEAFGRKHAQLFVDSHASDIAQLIAAYPDVEAHELLDRLRELFWTRSWRFCPEEAKGNPDGS